MEIRKLILHASVLIALLVLNCTPAWSAEMSHHAQEPQWWAVLPFVALLLLIATGPLFFEHFWHKFYPLVAMGLGALVVAYYVFVLHNADSGIHAGIEYIQFIALLASLFIASGGILIDVDALSTPKTNVKLLLIGALVANIIGTTGASMLLLRPYIRLNKTRIKAYHVVFFIFIVSNVGGSLTPIGDPPLFLGFLKGVPFEWTLINNVLPWALAVGLLCTIFYFIDKKNIDVTNVIGGTKSGKISIVGGVNFVYLGIIIFAVFIDPNVFEWVPSIQMQSHGTTIKISFLRELIFITICVLSYKFADKRALEGNEFTFGPIKEVAFLFIGIFATMIPALELVSKFAQSDAGAALINHNTLYWCSGTLSSVLDNAPTYMNFATASISSKGGSIQSVQDVQHFASGTGIFANTNSIIELMAISIASVFFGAMTYIGNGPNFMVKSLAEAMGVKMPSFFEYITKYSVIYLLPILFIVWVVFFAIA